MTTTIRDWTDCTIVDGHWYSLIRGGNKLYLQAWPDDGSGEINYDEVYTVSESGFTDVQDLIDFVFEIQPKMCVPFTWLFAGIETTPVHIENEGKGLDAKGNVLNHRTTESLGKMFTVLDEPGTFRS